MGEANPGTHTTRWLPALAGVLLALSQPAFAEERTCAVAEATGEATLTHAGSRAQAQVGAELTAKDILKTGPTGRVDVACSDGTHVTLGPDTEIGLGSLIGTQGDDVSIGMSLHRGIARFLAPVRTWGTFNVFGPVAVASVRSTEWIMETPKRGTSVFVLAGVVEVQGKRGDTVRLAPTYGIDVAANGKMGQPQKWGAQRLAEALARLGLQ